MASTNFTTHYDIPLPLGTDLTTPMDYNAAFIAVDNALFGAETDAGNASIAAGNAVNTANAATEEVNTVAGDLAQEKAKIIALQTRVTNAENEIDDVRTDSSDMITAFNEPTATASHAYAIGDFFIYNNTLYKATAAIAIGDTITPDTNCTTDNITTELIAIKSDLTKFTNKTGTTSSSGILVTDIDGNKIIVGVKRANATGVYNVLTPYYHSQDGHWNIIVQDAAGNYANADYISVNIYYIEIQ